MNYHTLTPAQTTSLIKIQLWWAQTLVTKNRNPQEDKRWMWMENIIQKQKYNDNAKQFLNQMREMYISSSTIPKQSKPKPFRSTVNVNGFPMV